MATETGVVLYPVSTDTGSRTEESGYKLQGVEHEATTSRPTTTAETYS